MKIYFAFFRGCIGILIGVLVFFRMVNNWFFFVVEKFLLVVWLMENRKINLERRILSDK